MRSRSGLATLALGLGLGAPLRPQTGCPATAEEPGRLPGRVGHAWGPADVLSAPPPRAALATAAAAAATSAGDSPLPRRRLRQTDYVGRDPRGADVVGADTIGLDPLGGGRGRPALAAPAPAPELPRPAPPPAPATGPERAPAPAAEGCTTAAQLVAQNANTTVTARLAQVCVPARPSLHALAAACSFPRLPTGLCPCLS